MPVVGGAWAKIELEGIIFHILKFHIYPFQNSSDLLENLCGFPTPTSLFRTVLLQLHRGTGQLSPIHSTSYFGTIPRYKNLWGTIKREKNQKRKCFFYLVMHPSASLSSNYLFICPSLIYTSIYRPIFLSTTSLRIKNQN